MKLGWLVLALLLGAMLSVGLAPAAKASGGHYTPMVGDKIAYTESIVIDDGYGNYTGYVENDYYNGSLLVTGLSGPLVTVEYENTGVETNNNPTSQPFYDNGNFTFSDQNDSYVQGTDQQGFYDPLTVWFYMNNSLAQGGTFSLLNTPVTLQSTSTSYPLSVSSTGYAQTLFAEGTGSFANTPYGDFTATYSYLTYFDPSTGYILGYSYLEEDHDGSGNGFTYSDNLHVTSTTFALTTDTAPSTDTVTFSVSGSGCSALFNGGNFTNGQSTSVQAGATYLLAAYPCNGNSFSSWSSTAGTLGSSSASPTFLTVSSSGTLTANFTPVPTPFPWAVVIAVIILVLLFVLLLVLLLRHRRSAPRGNLPQHGGAGYVPYGPAPGGMQGGYGGGYSSPPPLNLTPSGQPAVQQIVVKETVKVPCAYCGTLIDSTATACPKCGAPRT